MKGVVAKSTGSWYLVRNEQGEVISCRVKGKFRLKDAGHTNPVAVGDKVEFEMEQGLETGIISSISPRQNYIIRKASNLSRQTHIIASNLDQAVLIVTLVKPVTSLGFMDRFLVTAEAYHIPAMLVFNKTDLYQGDLGQLLDETIDLYQEQVGYPCIRASAVSGEGLDTFRELLRDKTTLVSGHSGVGKSTLLNAIEPDLNLKTGALSGYHHKGQHTTTFSEMHALSFGGLIIDTPGIKEFGIVDIEDAELSHYFPEMRALIGSCRFNNCKHLNEPGCAVIKAVEEGSISEERYHSYVSILSKEDFYA